MLGKLFGKKSGKNSDKKSGYYLELSEEEIAALPEAAKNQAVAAVSKAAEAVSEAAEAVSEAAESAISDVAPAALTKASSKKAASKKAASKETAPPQKEAASPASMTDPIELIRTAIAATANKSGADGEAAASTFDYRAPVTPARRRRPGPSMSPFKSMAKSVKRSSGF